MTAAVTPVVLALPSAATDLVPLAASVGLVALAVLLVVRSVVLVGDDQVHLVTRDGDVEEVIEDGIHLRAPWRAGGWTISTSPIRFNFAGRSVETADGRRVQGDVSGRFRVEDPETLVSITRAFPDDVRRRIDEAYVTQVERLSWDDEADPRATLEERCHSEVERAIERWGVELEELEVERLELAE